MNIDFKLSNPYLLTVTGALVLIGALFYGNCNGAISNGLFPNLFFAVLTLLVSVIMAINSHRQSVIQKNSVKLHLFDKRYKIFEAIANSEAIIKNDHALSQCLQRIDGEKETIQNKLLSVREDLIKAERLSQAVFDKTLSNKIQTSRVKFDEVVFEHLQFLRVASSKETLKMYLDFCVDIQKPLNESLDSDANKIQLDPELFEKHTEILKLIDKFNNKKSDYSEWLKSSGMMTDFYEYLSINNLDK